MRLVFFSTPSIPVFCSCHQRNVNVSLYNESIGVGKEYLFTFFYFRQLDRDLQKPTWYRYCVILTLTSFKYMYSIMRKTLIWTIQKLCIIHVGISGWYKWIEFWFMAAETHLLRSVCLNLTGNPITTCHNCIGTRGSQFLS